MNTFQKALKAYLDRDENAESRLAKEVGCSQVAIHRYKRGSRFPNAATARLIDEKTSGEVPFAIWQMDFLTRSGIAA